MDINEKQEVIDARNKLDEMKKTYGYFEGKKKKNNAIMLNTVPKLVCFAMVAVALIQAIGAVALVLIGMKNDVDIANMLSSIAETDIVTIGITVIGIAVSVWVGLNIYLSLSKEESEKLIKKMEDEIKSIEECLDKVEDAIIYQKGVMWQEFINLLDSQRNENMLAAYFAYQFNRLFYEGENTDSLDTSYIHSLIRYEAEYLSMTRMYENGEKMSCYNQSERLIKSYMFLRKEGMEGSSLWKEVMSFYFDVQIADAKFYRNAVCLRLSGYRDEFSTEQMENVCDKYKELLNRISDTAPEYNDINSAKAYINNTIGYTYDLINQYEIGKGEKKAKRCIAANKYMKAAVELIGNQFSEKKARYLRNLGLTYERLKEVSPESETDELLDKAYTSYVESIKEDMSDYKSWNTGGTIILKKFERENRISERDTLLSKLRIEDPDKWEKELLKAKTQFEMSASEGKGFEDPYYKLVQVYTYLHMLYGALDDAGKQEEMRKGAEKYMEILEMMNYTGGGSRYAYRNYYEAIGEIEKANKINEEIGDGNNDVRHLRELYLQESDDK